MTISASNTALSHPPIADELTLVPREGHGLESSTGSWSPQSTNLGAELPALVVELARRGVRVTRVSYNPELWDVTPRKVSVEGRVVKLGWFRSMDPHALQLTGTASELVDLVAVIPERSPAHS